MTARNAAVNLREWRHEHAPPYPETPMQFARAIEAELSRPETEEELRARFEATYSDSWLDMKAIERDVNGHYKLMQANSAWDWFRKGAER